MTDELNTTNPEYDEFYPLWKKVDDICEGKNLQDYLIKINPLDRSDENIIRNRQYFERAVFYSIAGYTVRGMVGMLFRKPPKLNVNPQIEYVSSNINGTGVSIYQQSQEVCKDLIKIGRCGLWVDFPKTDGNTSVADIENLEVFATVKKFDADQIVQWEVEHLGAKIYLSRVLIKYIEIIDNEEAEVRLELLLDERDYRVKKWIKESKRSTYDLIDDYFPTDSAGNKWNQIPFQFVGSETNTYRIDSPPSLDIVRINIGHWNNSASYEDSVWFAGQVQPWMSGVSEEYIRMLSDNNMYVGSGRLLGVPSGETFGYAQSRPNMASREAMNDKVQMMIGLGAMFLQPGSAVKTATQSEGEKEVRHSILSLISSNVSEAYTQVLEWVSKYMGSSEEDLEYAITQDFVKDSATSADLQAIVASLMQGAIPFSDYVSWCQKYGYIDESKTVDEVSEEVEWKSPLIDMPNLDEDEE